MILKPSTFENAIRLQFDTLMKKVIDRTVKDYKKKLFRQEKREVLFSELPEIFVESISTYDEYELYFTTFNVYGFEIHVSDDVLSEALKNLSERKRNTILMYYYLEMSDTEISEVQQISRVGVYKNRMNALKRLRELIKGV